MKFRPMLPTPDDLSVADIR